MRCGEEEHFDSARSKQIPGKRLDAELIRRKAGELRMNRGQRLARRTLPSQKQRGSAGEARMAQEQPRQLCTRVAGHTEDRDLGLLLHQPISPSRRALSVVALFASGQMTNTVLSPAMVPTTSGHPSSSMPAATGCALPCVVITTS